MTHSDPISESIRPFSRRFDLFAALRALLAALTAGGFVFALMTLGFKITHRQADGSMLIWLVSGGAALAVLIAAFLVFRPNQTEIARQIDALGLKERIASMLALRDSTDEIADLQREDALRHLATVKVSALHGRISVLSRLTTFARFSSMVLPVTVITFRSNRSPLVSSFMTA